MPVSRQASSKGKSALRTLSSFLLVSVLLLLLQTSPPNVCHASSAAGSSAPPTSLPRSNHSRRESTSGSSSSSSSSYFGSGSSNYPPWNPSRHINSNGFLSSLYRRVPGEWETPPFGGYQSPSFRRSPLSLTLSSQHHTNQQVHSLDVPVRVRQVPGDGNCLFHSISLCLYHAKNRRHFRFSTDGGSGGQKGGRVKNNIGDTIGSGEGGRDISPLDELYASSRKLRDEAVALLKQPHRRLFLQGRECLSAGELVEAAAQQYGLTPDEYCDSMSQDSVWGGGPEIVALSNYLQRPIHVYELATTATNAVAGGGKSGDLQKRGGGFGGGADSGGVFCLRRMACFGSPRFDRNQALCILSADSRFPDLEPGQQLAAGNHFLAVFPLEKRSKLYQRFRRRNRRGLIRGGGGTNSEDDDDDYELFGGCIDDDDWDGHDDEGIIGDDGDGEDHRDGSFSLLWGLPRSWRRLRPRGPSASSSHVHDADEEEFIHSRLSDYDGSSSSILPQWMRWWWRQLILGTD